MTRTDIKIFNLKEIRIDDKNRNGYDQRNPTYDNKRLSMYDKVIVDSVIEEVYGDPVIELRIYNPDTFLD